MITVNDEPFEHEPSLTVADLLRRANYSPRLVAVWIDGEMVRRDAYASTLVPDGADVRLVYMISGG